MRSRERYFYFVKDLAAWLNKPSDIQEGIRLYSVYLPNEQVPLLNRTPNVQQFLFEKLRAVYYDIKGITHKHKTPAEEVASAILPKAEKEKETRNIELEKATKEAADKLYKEFARLKAQLFMMVPSTAQGKENKPDAIAMRAPYVEQMMKLQPVMDEAYNTYRYVCEHGKLPTPPSSRKRRITNAYELSIALATEIKNFSKLKNKDTTPERLALIQTKESRINKMKDELIRCKVHFEG